jgi:AAHS family 4-hydroxybenzoate transporter-like MFS transporter
MPAKLSISDVIDHSKFNAFQIGVGVLCGLCLVMDGFDVQSMGYVAPAIIQDWHVAPSALGPVFGAAPFGVLIGSMLCSMLADRFGRRPLLILTTLYFAILTLLTARANTVPELLLIRFVAGLGLGGIQPNAMALTGEYSPRKQRIMMMMIISGGFTAGAALGGFISAWLIPSYGWRSVFYFGGAIPLALALVMYFQLPESLQFMTLRGKNPHLIAKWLKRVDPSVLVDDSTQYEVHEEKKEGAPFLHLFRDGRAKTTVLLWVINFMNLINLYFLSSWLPTVARDAGYATSTAVMVGTMLQVGGTVGTVGLGWLIGRRGFLPVLTVNFALACASIAMIGQPGLSLALLFVFVTIAGWCIVGGQPGVNALAGTYYPTYLRSTGIGWGLGVGRIGAIVGPVVGGQLIGLHWSTHALFLAAALPALISAIVVFSLRWVMKPPVSAVSETKVLVH